MNPLSIGRRGSHSIATKKKKYGNIILLIMRPTVSQSAHISSCCDTYPKNDKIFGAIKHFCKSGSVRKLNT